MFNNKNVILVGNSVEMLNYEHGEFIDTHDVVMRMGRGIPNPNGLENNTKAIGTKSDVWVTGFLRENTIKQPHMKKEDKPPDAGSERNRDYGAPPEFKGLDDLETYKRAVNRWVVRTGFKPHEQAGKVIDSLPMVLCSFVF